MWYNITDMAKVSYEICGHHQLSEGALASIRAVLLLEGEDLTLKYVPSKENNDSEPSYFGFKAPEWAVVHNPAAENF